MIFQFNCYKKQTPQGKFEENSIIDIYAKDLEEATRVAKTLIDKGHYDLHMVIEDFKPGKDRPKYLVDLYGYYLMTPEGGLTEAVKFSLWDNDPSKIVERAKSIIVKKFYHVKSITEKPSDEVVTYS
jgi:hypothetical protein